MGQPDIGRAVANQAGTHQQGQVSRRHGSRSSGRCWPARPAPGHPAAAARPAGPAGLARAALRAGARIPAGDLGFPGHRGDQSGTEHRWDWAGIRALPRCAVTADLHCVTKCTIPDIPWEGVAATELLRVAPQAARHPRDGVGRLRVQREHPDR